MSILSGNPVTWSKAFDVARSSELFLGCINTSTAEMLKATHRVAANTAAPEDAATQLCSIQFGTPTALPKMPNGFSYTPDTVSGYTAGVLDSLPIAMLFSGGMLSGKKSVTLNLSYTGGVALTTIAPSVLPDPVSGAYPSKVGYKVVADGVTIVDTSITPTAAALSVALNRTVTNLAITLSSDDGACLWRNWLPTSSVMQSAELPNFGVLLDAWGGNIIPLTTLVISFGTFISPVLVSPNYV